MRFSGKDLVVIVENASSVEVALTFVTFVDIIHELEAHVTEGDPGEERKITGRLRSDVKVTYEHDDTAVTGNNVVLSGIFGDATNVRTIRVRPLGTGIGKTEYVLDAVCPKYGPSGPRRGDKLVGEARFLPHERATTTPDWANQT